VVTLHGFVVHEQRSSSMTVKRLVVIGLCAIACAVPAIVAVASSDDRQDQATGLVKEVRLATRGFFDVMAAMAAGYSSSGSCVSGPQDGAMGIHFPNGDLIGDGVLEAEHPEILIYEQRADRLRLLGVEYLVLADSWDARKAGPPVLMGQHFQYVGSPNRYGLPPFYELHVWAWKNNPHGMFVDWNPAVSCEEYAPESTAHSASIHGAGH
jgi:hypothetical protein